MPSPDLLAIEKCVASAHKCLAHAANIAVCQRDLGLYDDLQLHLLELERLQVDLLRSSSCSSVPRRPRYVSQTQERP